MCFKRYLQIAKKKNTFTPNQINDFQIYYRQHPATQLKQVPRFMNVVTEHNILTKSVTHLIKNSFKIKIKMFSQFKLVVMAS